MYTKFVPATLLIEEQDWNPELYVGHAQNIRLINQKGVFLKDIAILIDGWRILDSSHTNTVFFRQPNIAPMRFYLDTQHWQIPESYNKESKSKKNIERFVEPGDVVINRTLPFRAAWATSQLHRHPVDGNCIIIRIKKGYELSFWTAVCLNQPIYTYYLAALSRVSSLLPRITIERLSSFKLPKPPLSDLASLARDFEACNDAILQNSATMAQLKKQVEEYVLTELAGHQISLSDNKNLLRAGKRFAAEDITDSLIPQHVELSHLQRELKKELGWVQLESLLLDEDLSRGRFSDIPPKSLYVRLSDLDSDLTINWPEAPENDQQIPRGYQEPLTTGEVLISTLVTAPRVVYVGVLPEKKVYITDHLERLHFRETPAAWALLLQTSVIRRQKQSSAIGTVQQFASRASIKQLFLPNVPIEKRIQWNEAVIRHDERKAELETKWRNLWLQAQELFNTVVNKEKLSQL